MIEKVLEIVSYFIPSPLSKIVGAVFLFFGGLFIFGIVYVDDSRKFLAQIFFGPIFIYLGWELLKL
ncbi:MAG: hypothetical protein QXD43_00890 [Candidatus Aenigmatarchaeota archaeon]